MHNNVIKMVIAKLVSVLLLSASWSCSQGRESAVDEGQAEIAEQIALSISGEDVHGLLLVMRDRTVENESSDEKFADILAMRWDARPPANSRDVQTVLYGSAELQITSETGRFIQSLGELYDSSELTEAEYTQAMLLIDALLSSILASHNALVEDDVSTMQSALTQAALLRVVIAQELRKHELGEYAVLDDQDMQRLRDMARTHDFSELEQIP